MEHAEIFKYMTRHAKAHKKRRQMTMHMLRHDIRRSTGCSDALREPGADQIIQRRKEKVCTDGGRREKRKKVMNVLKTTNSG